MEFEINKSIPLLDALVTRKDGSIITTVYRKRTHKGQYVNYKSNPSEHVKKVVIKTLNIRTVNICSDGSLIRKEIDNMIKDFLRMGTTRNI